MKSAPFSYHAPRSTGELVALLGQLENFKVLAGGQSLMPMLNMRYVMPDHVIDINHVDGLQRIDARPGRLEIGAMTRQRSLERSPEIARDCPILVEALRQVGHMQTRSRGTIGGSLCHLDPAAEQPGIAALYDAELTVIGPGGTRQLPVSEWSLGFMTPNLGPDEVLTGITLKPWAEPHGYAFVEFARRHGDFAIVGVGCLLALDPAGSIRRAAISIVGIDTQPRRLAEAEAALVGQRPGTESFSGAGAIATACEALSDAQISSEYRQHLAGVLTRRALALAADRAGGRQNG